MHPECGLISAVLRHPAELTHVIGQGIDDDTFVDYHEPWRWILGYYERHGSPPSKASFKSRWPDVTVYRVDDPTPYVEEVMRAAHHRELVNLLDTAATDLSIGMDPDIVLRRIQRDTKSLVAHHRVVNDTDVIESWEDTFDEIARRVERSSISGHAGIPSGFRTLDEATGGFGPGELWVLAARLGQGKSWTAIRTAIEALMDGTTVIYDALEQSARQISMRVHHLLSARLGYRVFAAQDLHSGRGIDLAEYKEFLTSLPDAVPGKLIVCDTERGRVGPEQIAAQIERHKTDNTLVVIDYLTLLAGGGEEWQRVAKLSGDLKVMAEQYQVPIIAVAQINRQGMSKEPPGPETLAQSDSIGQDADGVITLRQMSDRVMRFRLAKYRHGRDGQRWWVKFDLNKGDFRDCTGDEANELMEADRELADED